MSRLGLLSLSALAGPRPTTGTGKGKFTAAQFRVELSNLARYRAQGVWGFGVQAATRNPPFSFSL